jgi:hypothetical protein
MGGPYPKALRVLAICFALLPVLLGMGSSSEMAMGLYVCCGGFVIVGIVEGLILADWFRLPKKNCVQLMIIANALSAWVGQRIVPMIVVGAIGPWDLYTLRLQFSVYLLIAWLATLILEWPLTVLCFQGRSDWWSGSLMATAVIQTVSWFLLGGFFFISILLNPLPDHHIVPPDDIPWPAGLVVYYFDEDGRTIRALDTDTGETQALHVMRRRHGPLNSAVYFDGVPLPADTEVRLLVAGEFGSPPPHKHDVEELGIRVETAGIERVAGKRDNFDSEKSRTRFPFGSECSPYSHHPLSIRRPHSDFHYLNQSHFETPELELEYGFGRHGGTVSRQARFPFALWGFRHLILLGDSLVLFQLGTDQICLLEMRTQRVALKMRGFGPLAVPKEAIIEVSKELKNKN